MINDSIYCAGVRHTLLRAFVLVILDMSHDI